MSFILGGLLSGFGQGMKLQALQDREDALERLRNKRQIESENRADVRTVGKENRAEIRSISAEERKEGRAIRSDERTYGIKKGLLETGGKIKSKQSEQDFREAKDLESHKGSIRERLDRVRSVLDTRRDAASIRLKDQLDSGKVDDILVDEAGNYVKVFKDGRTEATDIRAKPTASEQKRLDELEDDYQRSVRRAERRGDPIPERESSRSRGVAGASAKPKKLAKANAIPQNDLTNMYNEASALAAQGDSEYAGLSAAQIKAKVDQKVIDAGYALP